MTPEEQEELNAEILRMVERYKAGDAGRRVPMLEASQLPGQPAGNATAIPTTTFGGPDLDEYAYTGTPSPPVTHQETQFRPKLSTEHGQGPYPPLRAPGPLDPRTATPVPAGYTYGDDGITRDPNGVPAWEQKPPNREVAWDVGTAALPSVGSALAVGVPKAAGTAAHYAQPMIDMAKDYADSVGEYVKRSGEALSRGGAALWQGGKQLGRKLNEPVTGQQAATAATFGAEALPGAGFVQSPRDAAEALAALREQHYGQAAVSGFKSLANPALELATVGTAGLMKKGAKAAVEGGTAVARGLGMGRSPSSATQATEFLLDPQMAARARGILEGAEAPGQIATRLPTAVKATEDPFKTYLPIDTSAMRQTPDVFEHNVRLMKDPELYAGLLTQSERQLRNPERLVGKAQDRMVENLIFLHDLMPQGVRERSRLWYDGANNIAGELGRQHGLPVQSTAGVIAALSPQKDWFMNVSLAERVLSTMQQGGPWTPSMTETAQRIWRGPKNETILKGIEGKGYQDLQTPLEKAAWIRTYDEAHNPRSHSIITPEGRKEGLVLTQKGEPSGTGWGSLAEIEKAVKAAESGGDLSKITPLMGEKHKVRNFYNNILVPNAKTGDVTIDTHAVAGQMLQPFSGTSVPVAHNFGNSLAPEFQPPGWKGAKSTAMTGVQGTYGINADPYRVAAAERGVLPREMQSITWEGVRGLFPDTFKTPANAEAARRIWQEFSAGRLSGPEAREQIVNLAGGMRLPSWAQQ